MKSYKIVRFYHPSQDKENEIVDTGLSLEEARVHCNDENTREEGVFFDGYNQE